LSICKTAVLRSSTWVRFYSRDLSSVMHRVISPSRPCCVLRSPCTRFYHTLVSKTDMKDAGCGAQYGTLPPCHERLQSRSIVCTKPICAPVLTEKIPSPRSQLSSRDLPFPSPPSPLAAQLVVCGLGRRILSQTNTCAQSNLTNFCQPKKSHPTNPHKVVPTSTPFFRPYHTLQSLDAFFFFF
jgi:hypothetical protein